MKDHFVTIFDGTVNRPLGRQLFVEEEARQPLPDLRKEPSHREPYSWRTRARLFERQARRDRVFYGDQA
jgi:hypothetical protein